MEFKYSAIVDPSLYETHGLTDGIPLRSHKDPLGEEIGAIRAQEDWTRLVRPVRNYKGGLGADYTFIRVTVPECLPERLEVISYANEYAFLYDDDMEELDQNIGEGENRNMLDVFGPGAEKVGNESGGRGEKQLQSQILQEMMAIDKQRAITTMKAWATFVQLSAARSRDEPFASLEEYLPYRIIDAGEMLWYGTVTFGMALTIPDHEMDLCKQLARPGFAALSLVNDLYSWEKERDAARAAGQPHVINAIYVLMGEHSIGEDEAKEVCKKEIRKVVAEYVGVIQDTLKNSNISLDLKKYVEAIGYSHSGNLVWSLYCPRYHPKAKYNDMQLSMMERGLQETLKSYHEGDSTGGVPSSPLKREYTA